MNRLAENEISDWYSCDITGISSVGPLSNKFDIIITSEMALSRYISGVRCTQRRHLIPTLCRCWLVVKRVPRVRSDFGDLCAKAQTQVGFAARAYLLCHPRVVLHLVLEFQQRSGGVGPGMCLVKASFVSVSSVCSSYCYIHLLFYHFTFFFVSWALSVPHLNLIHTPGPGQVGAGCHQAMKRIPQLCFFFISMD